MHFAGQLMPPFQGLGCIIPGGMPLLHRQGPGKVFSSCVAVLRSMDGGAERKRARRAARARLLNSSTAHLRSCRETSVTSLGIPLSMETKVLLAKTVPQLSGASIPSLASPGTYMAVI